jgi:TrmH family RNA methyltransferase
VREAITYGTVHELFVTERAAHRHPDLVEACSAPVSRITERAAAGLSETATPQGIVAVCATLGQPVADALRGTRLVAVLAGVSDPGNAGTVIRVADAAGAGAVVFTGDAVDPHNGKSVRASAGSVFHLALGMERDPHRAVAACRQVGLQILAADPRTGRNLDDLVDAGTLAAPTAWLFGSEAHGLDRDLLAAADHAVAIPLYGRAESLNLATAAALCLYASARVHRRRPGFKPIT